MRELTWCPTRKRIREGIIDRENEWTSVNLRTIEIKQNDERIVCVSTLVFVISNICAICWHFYWKFVELMHNRMANIELGEPFSLIHIHPRLFWLVIFSSFIYKSLRNRTKFSFFSRNCILSLNLLNERDPEITWIVKQLVKCSQMSRMNIFHINFDKQSEWERDSDCEGGSAYQGHTRAVIPTFNRN